MLRKLLSLTLILSALGVSASGNWRIHPTFDGEVTRIVETPDYVYFTSRTLPEFSNRDNYLSLFRYDKEGEELQTLSTDNLLASNTVQEIQYSPQKGYLAVVYSNYDIDLIYDNGEVDYIAAYRLASPGYSKKVNSISVDPDRDRLYLATDFGYVAINDEKAEIAESRIYGTPLKSAARLGENFVIIKDDEILAAPEADPRMSISDYQLVSAFKSPENLFPLGEGNSLLLEGTGSSQTLYFLNAENGEFNISKIADGKFYNIENNKEGVTVTNESSLLQFYPDGTYKSVTLHDSDKEMAVSSYNLSEFWYGKERMGIKSSRESGGQWTVTRDFMLPDSPAPFISTDMNLHPSAGFMIVNYGHDYNLNDSYPHTSPILLSAYKNGRWKNYGPAYTNKAQEKIMFSPNGFAIDPDNPNLIYLTSRGNGLVRLNLEDPEDIMHLSSPGDPTSNLQGFTAIIPDQTGVAKGMRRFSAPRFDSAGNLWMSYGDYDNQNPKKLFLYCWTATDRKASTPSNVLPPQKLEVAGYSPTMIDEILPLAYSGHKNWLVYAQRDANGGNIVVIDTNGTPLDGTDDTAVTILPFVDRDGNSIDTYNVRCLWEDPSTGYVWVGHQFGVFYFNPSDVLNGDTRVTRIKVARNDGTNLADYLLNEVVVNKITADGNGRKWFATSGGGLVYTSADGKEILGELNISNSDLPDDVVFGLGYNKENNSMMISTAQGIAEYYISGSSSAQDNNSLKIYPNPVRPDYLGYVYIEGLPTNALVKIADASGNVVKELGRSSGEEVKWDVTNHKYQKVSSGVYYILVSSPDSDSSFANKGKVLVVN